MNTKERIEVITAQLECADSTTHTLFDASKSLGALILACGCLVEIIEDQQRRIDELEKTMRSHLAEVI